MQQEMLRRFLERSATTTPLEAEHQFASLHALLPKHIRVSPGMERLAHNDLKRLVCDAVLSLLQRLAEQRCVLPNLPPLLLRLMRRL